GIFVGLPNSATGIHKSGYLRNKGQELSHATEVHYRKKYVLKTRYLNMTGGNCDIQSYQNGT
ncbi:MAG TPA: hypothetical protein PKI08_00845, partial [Aquaticitalea sp.]|nr:hypothetical protein [Aquaticitalea sp.]